MKDKISFFVDKEDIEVKVTDDKVINITGMIGSGKTTLADKYRNDKKYIVISTDCLYRGQDKENMNDVTMEINEIIKKKFPTKNNELYFKDYYNEILNYINNYNPKYIFVIEGQHIYRYLNFEDIKGKLIIKRTCIFHCLIRSITRHIKKKKIELKNGRITKKEYKKNIWYWIKRRTWQIRHFKELNKFILELHKF